MEYLGTNSGLWAVTAGVYLSLMGPQGMYDLGYNMLNKANYLAGKIRQMRKAELKYKAGKNFNEVLIDFSKSGKTVQEINKALLARGIFGGYDLTGKISGMDNCALYCVTEKTSKKHIDTLIHALAEVL